MNFLSSLMLELNSPKSLHFKWFSLSEESILRYCTVWYCRSAALEAPFFPSAYSVASLSLWKLFVFQQLHRPLSGEHHHPLGADEAPLSLLFAQTAHLSLAVRPALGNAVQQQHTGQHRWGHQLAVHTEDVLHLQCCTALHLDVPCSSAASGLSSNNIIHMLRSVVDAKAEEIRILAAAHLQRSRWSTENIPLSPESEARYQLKKQANLKLPHLKD